MKHYVGAIVLAIVLGTVSQASASHNNSTLTNSEWRAECSEYDSRHRQSNCNKLRVFEQLDKQDGYDDNCIVVKRRAYCTN